MVSMVNLRTILVVALVCFLPPSTLNTYEDGSVPYSLPMQPLVRDGDAVFFVGNSFLEWNGRSLPVWLQQLGGALSPPVRIEVGSDIEYGNTPLGEFLTHSDVQDALGSGKYKVFVLQGEEYEAVKDPARFRDSVRKFSNAVRAAGAQPVLFMTWEFRWDQFLHDLAFVYDDIGREFGIPVIPVGWIYRDCDNLPYGQHARFWLTDGDLHQNQFGTAVNTYATFQMLTGVNPAGKNFEAPGNTNDDQIMRYFSDKAWLRVRRRLGWNAGS